MFTVLKTIPIIKLPSIQKYRISVVVLMVYAPRYWYSVLNICGFLAILSWESLTSRSLHLKLWNREDSSGHLWAEVMIKWSRRKAIFKQSTEGRYSWHSTAMTAHGPVSRWSTRSTSEITSWEGRGQCTGPSPGPYPGWMDVVMHVCILLRSKLMDDLPSLQNTVYILFDWPAHCSHLSFLSLD